MLLKSIFILITVYGLVCLSPACLIQTQFRHQTQTFCMHTATDYHRLPWDWRGDVEVLEVWNIKQGVCNYVWVHGAICKSVYHIDPFLVVIHELNPDSDTTAFMSGVDSRSFLTNLSEECCTIEHKNSFILNGTMFLVHEDYIVMINGWPR